MKLKLMILISLICLGTVGCKSKTDVSDSVIEVIIEEAGKSEVEQSVETKDEENEEQVSPIFKELENLEFYFSSGAGGWRTILHIDKYGNFQGQYSDSEMGSIGEGYPKGTYYICDFSGKFGEPVKVNEYTYSMKIEEIQSEKEEDTEEIIDEIMYYYSIPYGLDGTKEVLLYLPGAPILELPEEYMGWVWSSMTDPEAKELPFYGIYNAKEQNGFSSYEANN